MLGQLVNIQRCCQLLTLLKHLQKLIDAIQIQLSTKDIKNIDDYLENINIYQKIFDSTIALTKDSLTNKISIYSYYHKYWLYEHNYIF